MNKYKGYGVVNIGGKKRPIKGGTNATGIFCTLRDCDLETAMNILEDVSKWRGDEIRDMIFALLCAGCHTEKKEIDFTNFDIGDWMDERPEVITEIFNLLNRDNGKEKTKKKVTKV